MVEEPTLRSAAVMAAVKEPVVTMVTALQIISDVEDITEVNGSAFKEDKLAFQTQKMWLPC